MNVCKQYSFPGWYHSPAPGQCQLRSEKYLHKYESDGCRLLYLSLDIHQLDIDAELQTTSPGSCHNSLPWYVV